MFEQFEDPMLQFLLIAATISLIIGIIKDGIAHGWIEGLSIYIAVAIIVTVTAGNNYMKEKQFQRLVQRNKEHNVQVVRSGQNISIKNDALVVGDIMTLKTGEEIPTDCIVLSCKDLSLDEGAITGESKYVRKTPLDDNNLEENPNCFLFGGTLIMTGKATALVAAVGYNTQQGKAEETMQMGNQMTPLQHKLETIAD